jgi:hypothetical protein
MPDLYWSERNLLQAAAEGKQITEAEIRVLTDRLVRARADCDRYREAAEVFAHYYDALCDQLEGTDLAYLRVRGTLNERYVAARESLARSDAQSSERPADTPARGADDAESHGEQR